MLFRSLLDRRVGEEIHVFIAPKEALEQLTGYSMYQGVLAVGRIPPAWTLREAIERSVRRSLSFALLHGETLAGFGRVVTDTATVGYLCDFVIAEQFRGGGLGQWMLAQILAHPDLRGCRIDLFTRDAQDFYKPFGFGPHKYTSMVRYPEREPDEIGRAHV